MGSVTLHSPSYSSVGQRYASISCTAVGWVYPSDSGTTTTGDSKNGSRTTISYSNTVWSWSFSDGGTSSSKEPTHTFTGLTAGRANTVRGTLSARCTKTTTVTRWSTHREEVGKDEEGNPIYEDVTTTTGPTTSRTTVSLGSASDSVTVYTQPTGFSFGCSPGDYIADYATAANWNELADQVGKYKSWRNQSSQYSSYDYLKVSSGDWITASIYNSMASACGTSRVTADETLISAALFEALADAVSP